MATKLLLASLEQCLTENPRVAGRVATRAGSNVDQARSGAGTRVRAFAKLGVVEDVDKKYEDEQEDDLGVRCCFQSAGREQRLERFKKAASVDRVRSKMRNDAMDEEGAARATTPVGCVCPTSKRHDPALS